MSRKGFRSALGRQRHNLDGNRLRDHSHRNLPIEDARKIEGTGEGIDALETVDPQRIAGRILQKGDVIGLVERAQAVVDADDAATFEKKVLGRGRFTLEDFLVAMRQVQKMGPLDQLLKLVPGVPRGLSPTEVYPGKIKHIEAIILSMTPEERKRPEILNGSRRRRIARGSGRPVSEVNRLMKRFGEMEVWAL